MLRASLGWIAAAVALLALPGQAAAARTCLHVGQTVTVTATEGESIQIGRPSFGSNEIDGTGCDPEPTTANANTVNIVLTDAASQVTYDLFFGPLPIVINIDGAPAGTFFRFHGSATSANNQIAGANGADVNGGGTPEVNWSDVDQVMLAGNGSTADFLSTAGTTQLGGPFDAFAEIDAVDGNDQIVAATGTSVDAGNGDDTVTATGGATVLGGSGNDTVTGGSRLEGEQGNDKLTGDGDADVLLGGPGDDTLEGRGGNDTVDGGDDADTASFASATAAVSVDLGVAGQQPTGAGSDSLVAIEGLRGGAGDDRLFGIAGDERLEGGGGDDALVDRGGSDAFDGGGGNDSVSYAALAAPLSADLATGTAVAGGATDVLGGIEALIGGSAGDTLSGTPGADSLAGGAGPDRIDPRAGGDRVDGGAGADTLALRDGAADTATCGGDSDTAVADREDALTDCEAVDVPPPPPPPPPVCTPALEVPGNGADEDCDGADAPLRPVATTIANSWTVKRRRVVIRKLDATQVPAGARIVVRCKGGGCPFKRKTVQSARARSRVNLLKLFKKRRTLRAGARLTIVVSAPNAIAKTITFRVRAGKTPRPRTRCKPPGGKSAAC